MKRTIVINYPGDIARTFVFNSELSVEALLEKIFAWFNHGSGEECAMFLQDKMRSLSVNDFVRVDGQWYQCRGIGWEKVTDEFVDEIEEDVVKHSLYALHGSWFCLSEVMWAKFGRLA